MHTCAFVTFVMRNDAYVPGALVFGNQLNRQKVDADVICLVTPDLSKLAVQELKVIFDDVIMIDPIIIHHGMRHGRQDRPFRILRLGVIS